MNELLADLDRCDRGDILSVDIACNNCGHINANKDLQKCQKCGENINHLFRRCPNCRRLNRLDVETCADCDFEVGRHFRVLDLLKEANELRDVDPDKTMRLLLEVLKLEGGNREAKEMLVSLRGIQEQITEIIPEAEKAQKEGRLEDARGKWQDILSLAPRHVVATGKKKELDELIERYNANYDRSFVLMNQGKFPKARELLNECREMIPTRKETDEALRNLNKKEKSYNQHFEKANSLKRRKTLNSARKEFELCLEEAPRNEEALKLKAKVDKDISKAGELFSEAKNLLKMAEFESVGRNIAGIQEIQNDLSGFQKFVKAVEEKKNEYHDVSSKWRKALEPEVRDLNKAQGYLEAGLKVCPECGEATKLLNRVIRDKEQAKQLIEDAKFNIKAANFKKARSEIVQAEGIWPKVLQLSQTKENLKTTQQNYNNHFNAARELYEKKKDLDPAVEQVKKALKICPESNKAKSLEKKIVEDRETATNLLQEAKSYVPKADFDNASKNIKTAEGIWPNVQGLVQVRDDLKKRKNVYRESFKKATDLYKKKDLDPASKNAEDALSICRQSDEARYLFDKVQNERKRTIKLISDIPSLILSADFGKAKIKMKDAEGIWPNAPKLSSTKRELETKERKYTDFYHKAKRLLDRKKNLAVALKSARSAIEICPNSSKASDLTGNISGIIRKRKNVFFPRIQGALIGAAILIIGFLIFLVVFKTFEAKFINDIKAEYLVFCLFHSLMVGGFIGSPGVGKQLELKEYWSDRFFTGMNRGALIGFCIILLSGLLYSLYLGIISAIFVHSTNHAPEIRHLSLPHWFFPMSLYGTFFGGLIGMVCRILPPFIK